MADVPSPPPPPPENPFGMNNGEPDPYNEIPGDSGLGQAAPTVAAKPGRVFVVLGVVGLIVIFLLYMIFSSSSKSGTDAKKKKNTVVQASVEPPPLPPVTVVTAPPVLTPPSIPQPSSKVEGLIKPQDDAAAKAQELARMRSKMLVADGGGGLAGALGEQRASPTDPNSLFSENTLRASKVERVEVTSIGDLRRTIAQGRLIEATMESALNTDLPAPIRAIVSRDTFGEAGTVALIPKGSRLIGTYNTALTGGQVRVFVVWTRVIRPDGIDILIGSPLVDQIGQAGVGGQVDTKFQQLFARSMMSSLVSIGFAIGESALQGGSTTTTSNGNGSTTTGDAASTATVNALNRLGSVTDSYIQRFVDVRQTILVDQGTKVNVFVNRDVVFPSDLAGTRVIY